MAELSYTSNTNTPLTYLLNYSAQILPYSTES